MRSSAIWLPLRFREDRRLFRQRSQIPIDAVGPKKVADPHVGHDRRSCSGFMPIEHVRAKAIPATLYVLVHR